MSEEIRGFYCAISKELDRLSEKVDFNISLGKEGYVLFEVRKDYDFDSNNIEIICCPLDIYSKLDLNNHSFIQIKGGYRPLGKTQSGKLEYTSARKVFYAEEIKVLSLERYFKKPSLSYDKMTEIFTDNLGDSIIAESVLLNLINEDYGGAIKRVPFMGLNDDVQQGLLKIFNLLSSPKNNNIYMEKKLKPQVNFYNTPLKFKPFQKFLGTESFISKSELPLFSNHLKNVKGLGETWFDDDIDYQRREIARSILHYKFKLNNVKQDKFNKQYVKDYSTNFNENKKGDDIFFVGLSHIDYINSPLLDRRFGGGLATSNSLDKIDKNNDFAFAQNKTYTDFLIRNSKNNPLSKEIITKGIQIQKPSSAKKRDLIRLIKQLILSNKDGLISIEQFREFIEKNKLTHMEEKYLDDEVLIRRPMNKFTIHPYHLKDDV